MARHCPRSVTLAFLCAAACLGLACAATEKVPTPPPQPPFKFPEQFKLPMPASELAVDSEGNQIHAGSYQGQLPDFPGVKERPRSAGTAAGYVVKLSREGKVIWSAPFGGMGEQRVTGLAVDDRNDVYVAGTLRGDLTLGGQALKAPAPGAPQKLGFEIFIAKLSGTDGKKIWLQTLGRSTAVLSAKVAITKPTPGAPARAINVALDFAGHMQLGGGPSTFYKGRTLATLVLKDGGLTAPVPPTQLFVMARFDPETCAAAQCECSWYCCGNSWDPNCVARLIMCQVFGWPPC
jgi:hypothetical protein